MKPVGCVPAFDQRGEKCFVTETADALFNQERSESMATCEATLTDVKAMSEELQRLQRRRAIALKSRNMIANRLQAIVAGTLGYHSGMKENDRTRVLKEASDLIKKIAAYEVESDLAGIVIPHMSGIDALEANKAALEKEMVKLAKQLPAAEWVARPEQRGFGLLFLAIVIGETGDLHNYANPAKVWKRLGCAPHTFGGKTLMGATWKSKREGKLPAEEWEAFGYSPRRRSIAFLIGEGIVKQNVLKGGNGAGEDTAGTDSPCAGPYRARYDEAKVAAAAKHPDWKPLRCHLHAMLLATKRLLLNLWIEWTRAGATSSETETAIAGHGS